MDMVLITNDTKVWNPHCDSYADQEENFLISRGITIRIPDLGVLCDEDHVHSITLLNRLIRQRSGCKVREKNPES